jgi:hypothetical protein
MGQPSGMGEFGSAPDDMDPANYDLLSDAEKFFKEDSNDALADAARVFGLQSSNGGAFTPGNGHDAEGPGTQPTESAKTLPGPSYNDEVQE